MGCERRRFVVWTTEALRGTGPLCRLWACDASRNGAPPKSSSAIEQQVRDSIAFATPSNKDTESCCRKRLRVTPTSDIEAWAMRVANFVSVVIASGCQPPHISRASGMNNSLEAPLCCSKDRILPSCAFCTAAPVFWAEITSCDVWVGRMVVMSSRQSRWPQPIILMSPGLSLPEPNSEPASIITLDEPNDLEAAAAIMSHKLLCNLVRSPPTRHTRACSPNTSNTSWHAV